MNNSTILTLMKSAECKSAEDIRNYAKACVELGIITSINGQMTINMKSVIEITDYIVQGNDPDVLSYIREYYTENAHSKLGGLLSVFKFKSVWRKIQSSWGKMAPYIRVFTNGMYIPFNEEVLDTIQELLEEYISDSLELDESFNDAVKRFRDLPHTAVLKAIQEELSAMK